MLEARSLTKAFEGFIAVDGLDLTIQSGEVFCLLGHNGAGKSTVLHLFLNFYPPTRGLALVNGVDAARFPRIARSHLAYIPDNVLFYPEMSGLENLAFFAGIAGVRLPENRLQEFLERAGLDGAHHKKAVGAYSKGMRQKVALALALCREAAILLLDEPTTGLDPDGVEVFSRLMRDLSRAGMCVLMVTHDLFLAKTTAHRLGLLRKGRLVEVLDAERVEVAHLGRMYGHEPVSLS